MKNFGMVKASFLSILWLSVFSSIFGCETIQPREATQGSDTVQSGSTEGVDTERDRAQSSFNREDLCSLLSKKEVGAILKKKMEEPELSSNECKYRVVQPSALEEFNIQISYDDGSGFDYNRNSGRDQGRKIRDVKGIGHAAYFDDSYLHVLKGHVWLTFWTGGSGKHPSEKVMKALAKTAADRLPAQ